MKNYEEDFQFAEDFYEKKEYKKALELFAMLNDREETNDCLNYIGCCNLELGEYSTAIRIFENLIQQNPDWERPVFNLGRVYLKLKLMDEAFEFLKKAITINPQSEDGFYYLGVLEFQKGNYKIASEYYEKSLALDYNQPEVHNNLGICYFQEKCYEKALYELNISLNLDDPEIDTIYNIGLINLTLKKYKSALNIFLKLNYQFPEDIEYIMEIVRCYSEMGDLESCINWNDNILRLDAENKDAKLAAEKFRIRRDNLKK